MKKTLALLISTLTLSSAFAASGFHYGSANHSAKNANGVASNYANVAVINMTFENYTVKAAYQYSPPVIAPLGPVSSPTATLYFDINYPDNQVCFQVSRDSDGWIAYSGCLSSGNVQIGPYRAAANSLNSNSKPPVTVTK